MAQPRGNYQHHALLIVLCPLLFNFMQLSSCESGQVYSDQHVRSVNCSYEALPLEATCRLEYPTGCQTGALAYQVDDYPLGGYPSSVKDVQVKPAYLGPFVGRCYTGIRVSFKLPRIGLQFLKGVEIKVFPKDGTLVQWCFAFNLTKATLSALLHDGLRFEAVLGYFGKYDEFPIGSTHSYDVQVASLPKKDSIIQKEVTSFPWGQNCLLGPKPEMCTRPWHDELEKEVFGNSALVKMACLPKGFYYKVDLFWRGPSWTLSRLNGTKRLNEGEWEATFTDMMPGNYQFGVSVWQEKECLNYRYRYGNQVLFRQCAAEYQDFNITTPLTLAPTTETLGRTDEASLPKMTVVAITLSLVGLVAALIIGVGFVKLKNKERAKIDGQPYGPVPQDEHIPRLLAPPEPHDPLDSVSTAQNLPFDPSLYDQTDPTTYIPDSGVPTPDSNMISPDFTPLHGGVFYEPAPAPYNHHDPPGAPSIVSHLTNATGLMNIMLGQPADVPPPEVGVRGREAYDDGIASYSGSVTSIETV